MPVYIYRCSCSNEFEILRHTFENGDVSDCPECGGKARRIVAACYSSFGWRPSEAANERFGPREEMERDI